MVYRKKNKKCVRMPINDSLLDAFTSFGIFKKSREINAHERTVDVIDIAKVKRNSGKRDLIDSASAQFVCEGCGLSQTGLRRHVRRREQGYQFEYKCISQQEDLFFTPCLKQYKKIPCLRRIILIIKTTG